MYIDDFFLMQFLRTSNSEFSYNVILHEKQKKTTKTPVGLLQREA